MAIHQVKMGLPRRLYVGTHILNLNLTENVRYLRLPPNARPVPGAHTRLQPLCTENRSPSVHLSRPLRSSAVERHPPEAEGDRFSIPSSCDVQSSSPPAQYDPIRGSQLRKWPEHRRVCRNLEGNRQREYDLIRLLG